MTGLCKGNRVLHGLGIADFTDQDHVWSLAQGIFERMVPGMGVHANLAVAHQRLLGNVHVLHRVFHRNDVPGRLAVAVVDQCRQGGGLARSRATNHQHQAALVHDDFFEHRRQCQLLKVGNLGGNGAHYHCHVLLLHVHIDAKTRQPGDGDGEIALQLLVKLLLLALIHQRMREGTGQLPRQLLVRQRLHRTIGFHARREIVCDKQIRASCLPHGGQQFVHVGACLFFGKCCHGVKYRPQNDGGQLSIVRIYSRCCLDASDTTQAAPSPETLNARRDGWQKATGARPPMVRSSGYRTD